VESPVRCEVHAGSGGDTGKLTGSNAGRAPRVDLTYSSRGESPSPPTLSQQAVKLAAGRSGWRRCGYQLAGDALGRLAADLGSPQEPVLWPEHFDVGITVDAVSFGASPGDEQIPRP
jgi:hypothetical protein